MIKISVIKKYLFVGLFCLGLGITQQVYTGNSVAGWLLGIDLSKLDLSKLDLTKEVPTKIVNHSNYMFFIGLFSALTAGSGAYILASGFASKNSEKNKDQQAKDNQDAAHTKKTVSTRKIPKYVWAGLSLMVTGISGIIFSNQLASILDSVVNKPQPAAPAQQK